MPKYFFILGQNKNLSIAELASILSLPKELKLSDQSLIVNLSEHLNPAKTLNSLGGTVKIGEIGKKAKNLEEITTEDVLNLIKQDKGSKIYFGISLYNGKVAIGEMKQMEKLAMKIKKKLKDKGFAVRWVSSKEAQLSSVIVKKNKLLDFGAEIVLLRQNDGWFLGRTLAVQEFADYSFRDYGRPARDKLSGMLPVKLAKIMINLAKAKKEDIILDPFCGSGTILSEALLLGYQNLIGSDISAKAITDTKANLEWLRKNYQILRHCEDSEVTSEDEAISRIDQSRYQLFNLDARSLSQKIGINSIDAIVTEPYLGPVKLLKGEKEVKKVITQLEELYLDSFKEFSKILKSGARIVIVFPIFKVKNNFYQLEILDKIQQLGFVKAPFLPKGWTQDLITITARGSLIYSRPDQHVLREIFSFKKA